MIPKMKSLKQKIEEKKVGKAVVEAKPKTKKLKKKK